MTYTTENIYHEGNIWMRRVTKKVNGRVIIDYSEPVPEEEMQNYPCGSLLVGKREE